MSKSNDLLGLMFSTATVPIDDDPGFDDKGYTALITPEDNNPADEDEDDNAFRGLLDAGLSQQEAQAEVDFMKPLSDSEREILATTPLLDGLTKIDDPEHDGWLGQKSKEKHDAIDRALEDAVYGDNTMAHDEELLERTDSDSESGFGFRRAFKKLGHGIRKAGSMATSPIKKVGSLAAHLIPGDKARKARLLRNTYRKLWYEHANWLAHQDKAANLPLKPRTDYEMVAKLWAKDQMKQNKLPTSFDTSGADVLGAQILGANFVGSWFWPFGNLLNFSRTTVNNTSDKRADAPPDEQSDAAKPDFQPIDDPSAPDGAQPSSPDDQQGEPDMQGWNGIRNLHGNHDIQGEDSLGAFATEIMGGSAAQPARDNPHAEQIVKIITLKLKAGKAISPSELGLLSSAAKEGNISAQKVLVVLEARGMAVSDDESGLDPWMYKLSPGYWFASKRKKDLIDTEKKNWVENADLQRKLTKQKDVLNEAERAAQAARAVAEAKQQSADTEAKLKEIEASLKGSMSGTFVGHEKIMPISDVVVRALEKTGKKEKAGKLYGKIKSGQPLDASELKEARQIANLIGRMKVVHGDLVSESEETLAMHGAFIGACVMGGIEAAKEQNGSHGQFAEDMGKKIASGQALTPAERNQLAKILSGQAQIHKFTASLVSGAAFVGCPQKKTWTKGAFVGAVRAMSDQDKKMLSTVVKLAKIGNPRAQKALVYLKKSGEIMGGEGLGESPLQKAFNYAAAPIKLAGDDSGWSIKPWKWGKKSPSAQDVRLAKMKAAQKRLKAAQAKAAAADAETEAEQRAQQAIADAADAEADAADAEAMSKEQKMKTAEAEANPDSIPTAAGDFIGGWTDVLGKGTKESKIVAKASEQSATGTKIRSGATLYVQAKKGNPKAVRSIRVMVAKAKKGDPQAIRDVNSVKAGRIAVRARAKAQKRQLVAQKRAVRKAKVASAQRKIENPMGDRLARMSRKHELKKLAIVERKAAKGNPKAKVFVAKRVAASKRGDKKALAQVQGMKLGRTVRLQVTSKQEAKRMKAATRMAARLHKNDPKAVRQYTVLKDAANHGNPNAQRAMKRLAIGGALVATVATGAVVLPKLASAPKPVKKLRPGTLGYKKAQRQIAMLRKKIKAGTATPAEIGYGANLALQMNDTGTATFLASLNDKNLQTARQQVASAKEKAITGTGTREELTCSAKIANQIGDRETAGMLALKASTAPSSTEKMKQTASEVAAAQSGNPTAQASLEKTVADAKTGNVEAIDKLGNVMAVKTIDAANKGQPISPTMADAINTHALAQSGDPAAQETLQKVSEAATQPNPAPEATLAAGAAVGAAAIASSLSNKPKARQELLEKVNPPIPAIEKGPAQAEVAEIVAKVNEGTATPEEGVRGVELARRLGKPKLAAEIQAKAPPCDIPSSTAMSSLPDVPLLPIRGAKELIKESLRAVTLTTQDPLANYREGVASRSKDSPSASPSVPVTSSGWSPFKAYQAAKKVAPFTPFAAPFAAASALANASKKKGAPAPETAPATAPAAETPATTATAGAFVGSSDSFKDLIANALQSKKMSKSDFNKAIDASVGPNATPFAKKALGEQTLKFLQDKKVTVGGTFVGAGCTTSQQYSKEHVESKLRAAIGDLRDKKWNKPLPIAIDISLLNDLKQSHETNMLLAYDKLVKEGTVRFTNRGPRLLMEGIVVQVLDGSEKVEDGHVVGSSLGNFVGHDSHSRIARPAYAAYMKRKKQGRKWGQQGDDSLGDFVGTFVGKSDEFKQLIIAALKAKKMSKDDFNKAVAAHVKPGASPAERTAAGERMLKFLGSKNVAVSGWSLFKSDDDKFHELMVNAIKTKKISRDDFNKSVILNVGPKATPEAKEQSAKQMLQILADKGVKIG